MLACSRSLLLPHWGQLLLRDLPSAAQNPSPSQDSLLMLKIDPASILISTPNRPLSTFLMSIFRLNFRKLECLMGVAVGEYAALHVYTQ